MSETKSELIQLVVDLTETLTLAMQCIPNDKEFNATYNTVKKQVEESNKKIVRFIFHESENVMNSRIMLKEGFLKLEKLKESRRQLNVIVPVDVFTRHCKFCGRLIDGRSDKLFCNANHRYQYFKKGPIR